LEATLATSFDNRKEKNNIDLFKEKLFKLKVIFELNPLNWK
jgi:hypothetical protein